MQFGACSDGDLPLKFHPAVIRASAVVGASHKVRPVQLRISGWLGASACCSGGWIKDNGVMSPIALWGLTSLYSVRRSSTFSRTSSTSRNQCRPGHSNRTAALKLSTYALSVGFPGRLKSSVMPFAPRRSSTFGPMWLVEPQTGSASDNRDSIADALRLKFRTSIANSVPRSQKTIFLA
jgi:hypothetical protein